MQFFTIDISEEVGFGDQLNQLFILYHVGTSLGLEYLHADISSKRTQGGIWAELKLESQFRTFGDLHGGSEFEFFDLAPSVPIPADGGPRNLQALISDIRSKIPGDSGNYTILRLRLGGNRLALSRLVATLPNESFDDFREKLGLAIRSAGWSSPFSHRGAPKVLVHIRKGDTATLPVPWHGDLTLWHHSASIAGGRYFDEFPILRATVSRLADEFASAGIELVIFSDGYERSKLVVTEALAANPSFDAGQIELINAIASEKDREISLFEQIPGVRCFLGEDGGKFRQLLRGLLDADLVISNNSQRMAAKTIGALPANKRPRCHAVVGRPAEHRSYFKNCLTSERHCHFAPVQWETFSLTPLVDFLSDLVSDSKPKPPIDGLDSMAQGFGHYDLIEWKALGTELLTKDRCDQAIDAFNRYARLSGDCDDGLKLLAEAFAKAGNAEEADKCLARLDIRSQARQELRMAHPSTHAAVGRYSAALEEIALLEIEFGENEELGKMRDAAKRMRDWEICN